MHDFLPSSLGLDVTDLTLDLGPMSDLTSRFASSSESSSSADSSSSSHSSRWESTVASGSRRLIKPRVPLQQRSADTSASETSDRPMSFHCPACMVVLTMRQPTHYDGRPAPCPHCGVSILPPRIATAASPISQQPLPGLSQATAAPKAPRVIHRPDRRGSMTLLGENEHPPAPVALPAHLY